MDKKYQDIHVINILTQKKVFEIYEVFVTCIHFTDDTIIISYATPTIVETKMFPKEWNKLIIN